MSSGRAKYLKFGSATVVILLSLVYLSYTGVQDSKSYYVTIKELNRMGQSAYSRRLRVAGTVVSGSIKRSGLHVDFLLSEENQTLPISYVGTEALPDTFKDNSETLADGNLGRDGILHAEQLQAKCASKYTPRQEQPGATRATGPGKLSRATLEGAGTGQDLVHDSRYRLSAPRVSEEVRASHVADR